MIKAGFWGIGIFLGLATILVGIFPCDQGCNKDFVDPSVSQLIHNLTGFMTYIFVPISIIAIGIGLRKFKGGTTLASVAFLWGFVSIIFISLMFSDPMTNFVGLYQRIAEASFLVWIISCSIYIKKDKPNHTIIG